jgi:N-dimethylarginine dimethylaminohydrolase
MKHICIRPTSFEILPIQDNQNPYIDIQHDVNGSLVAKQHKSLIKAFSTITPYTLPPTDQHLPDIVFVANGGLCLPRLPKPLILLPWMKYQQRKAELPFLKQMFAKLKLPTVDFPGNRLAPFEGQAELKWFFGGRLAVCGPGHRSSRRTFEILNELLTDIYHSHDLEPPTLLIVPLISADYYHLDVAMLEFDDTSCIVHRKSMSSASIARMRKAGIKVHVIDTADSFCLNAVVDKKKLITHVLSDRAIKPVLEEITGRTVVEVDTSEFEKSGGSVRCMTLDVF